MDRLVLHEDELNDLAFDLTDLYASEFEDIETAPLVEDGLAHVVEGTIVENDVSHVELANRPRVRQNASYRCAVQLLIEIHVLKADFYNLGIEFDALRDLFEVEALFKGDPDEGNGFDHSL